MIRYYTANEIAGMYRKPLGTIWRLAATDHWRRSDDGKRPALYLADDVEATMARLAGATSLDTLTCGEV